LKMIININYIPKGSQRSMKNFRVVLRYTLTEREQGEIINNSENYYH
jgi:hypothetical protein